MKLRTTVVGAALLAAALPASAQIKVNDNLSFNGWAVGSYQYNQPSPGTSSDSFNADAALFGATMAFKPVTAVASLYYKPGSEGGVSPSGSELTVLDAYLTYDAGNGVTITGGKFLSYLGYESFYPVNMDQITYANGALLGPIPGYHEGVKVDIVADKTVTIGAALVDSLNSRPGYNATEGDGEFKHNAGAEAYISYTGISALTIWGGIGYDSKGNFETHDEEVYDIWAAYQISKVARIAAEEVYKDGGPGQRGSNWLAFFDYSFTDKFSSAFRISGEDVTGRYFGTPFPSNKPSYVKYTICPAYALTANLSVRLEYSYTNYSNYQLTATTRLKDSSFVGLQGLFKF